MLLHLDYKLSKKNISETLMVLKIMSRGLFDKEIILYIHLFIQIIIIKSKFNSI